MLRRGWAIWLARRPNSAFDSRMTIGIARMTKEEYERELKALRDASKEICRTPETARAFLIKHGFITKSGKLTKRYGG